MAAKPDPEVDDTILTSDDNFLEIMQETNSITDWSILPLLLGISNADKIRITQNFAGQAHIQHQKFIEAWIKSENATWATLVGALRHELVKEGACANKITKNHPRKKQTHTSKVSNPSLADQQVASNNQPENQSISTVKTLNQDLVDINKQKIKACYREDEFKKSRGIIFIIGVHGADGTAHDVENVESTFRHLNFAAFVVRNPTADEIACLMKAAGDLDYPFRYEYVAFYFAGHGGTDKDGKRFIIGLQKEDSSTKSEIIHIDDYIIKPLKPLHADRKLSRIFFFDCCQSESLDVISFRESRGNKSKGHPGQLEAYATNIGQKSWGDKKQGGIWTHHLCKNLRELKGSTISDILDRTYDDVTEEQGDFQEPLVISSLGRRILNEDGPVSPKSKKRKIDPNVPTLPPFSEEKKQTDDTSKVSNPSPADQQDETSLQVSPKRKIDPDDPTFPLLSKDSSTNISNKTPELNDVYQLLEDKSVDWDRIGKKLGVPMNDRVGLQRDQSLTNDQRLETVLNLWLQQGGDLSTWDQLMKSLVELKYNDVVGKIRQFLEMQPQ